MRNVLVKVPKGNTEMVAAAIRTVFAQRTGPLVRAQVETVAAMLEPKLPVVADKLRKAREEITAFADFPKPIGAKCGPTTRYRLNREVKRHTDVGGIFPNPAALQRLSPCVLSRHTTDGKSATNATSPKPPWLCSPPPEPTAQPTRPADKGVIDTTPAFTA